MLSLKKKSKKKPLTTSKLKKKLWKFFSLYIRQRDRGVCFICNRRCEGSGYHASHFIPKSVGGLELYFHEDNVHGCCYNCNINLGGNLYEYGLKLGKDRCESLYRLKRTLSKWDSLIYQRMIDKYEKLCKEEVN